MVLIAMLLFAAPAYAGNDKPLDFSGINSEQLPLAVGEPVAFDPFAPVDWSFVSGELNRGRLLLCRGLARSMERMSSKELLAPLQMTIGEARARGYKKPIDAPRAVQGILEIADDLLAISKKHCQPPKEKVQ